VSERRDYRNIAASTQTIFKLESGKLAQQQCQKYIAVFAWGEVAL
jgi:hypothetical protein